MSSLFTMARACCPPILWQALKRASGRSVWYSGPYATWSAAQDDSAGYDSQLILERVVAATDAVIAGRAAFERDSVLFEEPDLPYHLLTALLRAAAVSAGRLSVLDFGGSLGSTYRQCRQFLPMEHLTWNVVEQAAFVSTGKARFQTDELRFHSSPQEVLAETAPNIVLFSSVLQYLEDPMAALQSALLPSVTTIAIDRTPFGIEPGSKAILVQHVPQSIYPASYPMRVLDRRELLTNLAPHWTPIASYTSAEGRARSSKGITFEFQGFILVKQ